MPQVLICSREDWANMGYMLARSLRAVDIDALAVSEHPHGFNYPEQAKILPATEILALGQNADVIIHMHSHGAVLHKCNAHHVVFHGGTTYRRAPENMAQAFNKLVDFTIVQTGDLLGLGAKNEIWLLPPVDTELIRVKLGIPKKILSIAHYPRDPKDKGSGTFTMIAGRLRKNNDLRGRFIYDYSAKQMPWIENMERMGKCDIYLESFLRTHCGLPHLSWGVTALEAAALGKIVVTNFKDIERYEREYGPCALQVANTRKQLLNRLTELCLMSRDELELLQVQSRQWVEKYHSFQAVGERLKAAIEKYCWNKGESNQEQVESCVEINTEIETPEPTEEDCRTAIEPEPLQDFDARGFWETWGSRPTTANPIIEAETTKIAGWLSQYRLEEEHLLEVGPGDGLTYRLLREQITGGGLAYHMADFVQSARDRCYQQTGIIPDEWDGSTLPYGDNTFGAVLSTDVMLHVPPAHIEAFIREHARVSKEYLIISTYIGSSDNLAAHCFKHDYEALFNRIGLKILETFPTARGNRTVWLLAK